MQTKYSEESFKTTYFMLKTLVNVPAKNYTAVSKFGTLFASSEVNKTSGPPFT